MVRNAICYFILVAMAVHCAGRTGVLSYVYQKRELIAFSLGMIAEPPIAICSSHYDFGKGLKLASSDHDQKAPGLAIAAEINLFFIPVQHGESSVVEFSSSIDSYWPEDQYCLVPSNSIFHPPLV